MTVTATQASHTPGSQVEVRAILLDSGIPLERQASVSLHATMPGGGTVTVPMTESEPGVHRTMLTLPYNGLYPLLVHATGQSLRGTPFTREELRSAAVWSDPIVHDPDPTDDRHRWCELLLCLLQDDRLGRLLAKQGVNLDGVRDCVKKVLPALSWRRTLADGRVSVPHPADS
jgi:hypothetical protein